MPDIAFVKPALPRSGALVAAARPRAAARGRPGARRPTRRPAAPSARALEAAGFKGRKGQSTTLWAPGPGLQGGRDRPRQGRRPRPRERRGRGRRAGAGAGAGPRGDGRGRRRSHPRWPPRWPWARCCAPTASTATARRRRRRTSRSSSASPSLTADAAAAKAAFAPLQRDRRWRLPDARPGQRAAQRAAPGRIRRALQGAGAARRRGRDPGPEGDEEARLRRAARRGAGQRAGAAHGGDAVEGRAARARSSKPLALHRQGRDLRHRRHLHQAGRRHGGHEVGHGRRRRGGRR